MPRDLTTPARSKIIEIGSKSATMNGLRVLDMSCKSFTFVRVSMIGSHKNTRIEVKIKMSINAVITRIFRYSLA